MTGIGEFAIAALICLAAFFLFVGSLGLAKLPDLMRRLHGPTKATTLGIGSLLIASMMFFLFEHGELSFHEVLITIFLFLTAPITANMIAKAHMLHDRRVQREMPPAGDKAGWATVGRQKAT